MQTMYQIFFALFFHILDLITGLIGAVRMGNIESSKMRDGMFKKVGFIFCYVLAFVIDAFGDVIGFNIGFNVLPILVTYSVTTEFVSITENIHKINPDLVPQKLIKMFNISVDKKGE